MSSFNSDFKNLNKNQQYLFETDFLNFQLKALFLAFVYKLSNSDLDKQYSKPLSNCNRRNKGNFTSKSNSNKIMLCVGQHYLVLNKISKIFHFQVSLQFLSEFNNIFQCKRLKKIYFSCKINCRQGKDLTRKILSHLFGYKK